LWHLDMTKVWTAQHGRVYLHAIIDCCTREITGWSLELRCHRRRGDRLRRGGGAGAASSLAGSRSALTMAANSPLGTSAGTYPPAGSPTVVVATGIRSRSVHRVVVRAVQETPGLAIRMGIAGAGEKGDHRLCRQLPSSAPLRAGLPHPSRGRRHLAPRPQCPTNPCDLTCQRRRGPRHLVLHQVPARTSVLGPPVSTPRG
jgi:hypothetical protein